MSFRSDLLILDSFLLLGFLDALSSPVAPSKSKAWTGFKKSSMACSRERVGFCSGSACGLVVVDDLAEAGWFELEDLG